MSTQTRKEHILIVEDDEDIQQLVSFNLVKAGFQVSCANNGEEGYACLKIETIDCILLDLMLPGMSGAELCRKVKAAPELQGIPVIMMTAKREEEEIVAGLESGADDYITKPFSPKVLVARVKAVLRRSLEKSAVHEGEEIFTHDGLTINPGRHEVLVHGENIHLTMTEFSILATLGRRPGWVFSRQQIIDSIRGYDYMVTARMIDVHVFNLRKKLGPAGNHIDTVRGVGYRFKEKA